MKKIVDVYILPAKLKQPADHLNDIFLNDNGVLSFLTDEEDIIKSAQWFGARPQNLYFTLNERIQSGDWYLWLDNKQVVQANSSLEILENHRINGDVRKIVATTDTDLYLNNNDNTQCVAPISIGFIMEYNNSFNKSNPINKVLLEYEVIHSRFELTEREQEYKLKLSMPHGTVITTPLEKKTYDRDEVYKMFTTLSYEMAQQILGNISRYPTPIVPHEWFEQNYPEYVLG